MEFDETGRPTDAPPIAKSPMELLTNPSYPEPFLREYAHPLLGGGALFIGTLVQNALTRRPMYSGIHSYVFWTLVGIGGGFLYKKYRLDNLAERDAMYRHYISLHPDDFPPFERIKIKDVFEPWHPVR